MEPPSCLAHWRGGDLHVPPSVQTMIDARMALGREPRPVASAFRELLGAFGQISSVANAEVFALSDQPARLKVHV